MDDKRVLLDLTPEELGDFLKSLGQPAFRAGQVFTWLHRGVAFADMGNLPATLRAQLNETCVDLPMAIQEVHPSRRDDTVKFLFACRDGNVIEGVLMRYRYGYSLCISTQVGCKMGCAFCASTLEGCVRSLSAGEMLSEVLLANRFLGERGKVGHVVLMGSGEPLDNYDQVVRFLRLLNAPQGLNISLRNVSLSTCGLVEGIRRLEGEHLPVTLSISLHAPNDEIRRQIMPVARTYPIAQLMEAVTSGRYDTDHLALIMSQTGGCCRASNYIAFIRRALKKAGLEHIPVISLNANGMETNEGFRISPSLLLDAAHGIVLGDLLMRCLYRVRPYELEKGSANALHHKWRDICIDSLTSEHPKYRYAQLCRGIVEDFDALPIDETLKKPRVGVVGEILVKYMPLANNHVVDLLEREGAEAVVPDLLDFFAATIYEQDFKHTHLGKGWTASASAKLGIPALQRMRRPAIEALKASKRFDPPMAINHVAELAKPFLSIGNQYGEGWFLAGEMAELITSGTPNIVCIQPFACLPNHVVGKGVIKALRKSYPWANIVAVDYDPGASEVNQLNRIKLMISVAKENYRNARGEDFKLVNDDDPTAGGGEDYGIPLSDEQRARLEDIKARAAVD